MDRRSNGLFHEPARAAARRIARDLLDAADRAAMPLDGGHPEALHDFRVALRRLRCFLKAYRDTKLARKGQRNRLRELARQTSQARDLEVALDDLRAYGEEGDVAARHLMARLASQQSAARAEAVARVRTEWPPLAERLRRALDTERLPSHETFALLTSQLVETEWFQLRRLLDALRDHWCEETAHRVRLTGKRLRYLLEPLAPDWPGATTAIAALKRFQDDFGRYHDHWVLLHLLADDAAAQAADATRARILGEPIASDDVALACSLAARLREDREKLAEILRSTYVTPDSPPPLAVVARTIADLRDAAHEFAPRLRG